MPLLAILLLNVAAGLVASLLAVPELRASPRALGSLRCFAALCAHEAAVTLPLVTYVALRHPDWMVSYAVAGAQIPSAVSLGFGALAALGAVGGFAAGAYWCRTHRARLPGMAAGACAFVALVGLAVMHRRVGVVGSAVQFRGGFGLRPLMASRVPGTLLAAGVAYALAYAHLGWSLRARLR